MTQILNNIVFYVFICVLNFTHSQNRVGDVCNLPVVGKGICKNVADCPKAILQSRVGINPNICNRTNKQVIVCCEGAPPTTPSPIYTPNVTPVTTKTAIQNSRKSQQKCHEYSEFVQISEITAPSELHGNQPVITNCPFNGQPLIFGGTEAVQGEFPHMALLGYRTPPRWGCGGTLISEQFVLTAAHCLVDRNLGQVSTVRLGELNIAKEEIGSRPEDFGIAENYRHPEYNRTQVYNDIALIKLSRTVQFDSFKRPACLWNNFDIGQNFSVATGWGTTEKDPSSRSNALLKVGLDIIENNICNNMYQNYFSKKLTNIRNNLLCATNISSIGDTCQGDSGGPIQIVDPNNRCIFFVIGVTAAGRGCGGNLPSLYTRVSEYIDWIEQIVWP